MVHDPEPEPEFPENWEDDDQLLFEDDFEDLEEEELDLLQEMREEAAAGEWLTAAELLDDTRDQPDG